MRDAQIVPGVLMADMDAAYSDHHFTSIVLHMMCCVVKAAKTAYKQSQDSAVGQHDGRVNDDN
jgi:hypothetical protein